MRRRWKKDKGANLVEFAILMPLLVMLLLGIVEFGWGLAQQIDVRHKARETLRLAIVDEPQASIIARACEEDVVDSGDITEITLATTGDPGDPATATITANVEEITGLFGAFWGPSPTISSTVEGRIEQEMTAYSPGTYTCP